MNQVKHILISKPFSHIFFGGLILFTLSILVWSTFNAYQMVGKPFPGFSYFDFGERYAFINATNQTHWTGMEHGGLKFQDVVAGVQGRAITDYQTIDEEVKKVPVGTPLHYLVITWRGSEVRPLDIPTMLFTLKDFFLVYGITFLVSIALLIMVLIVYVIRPFSQGTWAFSAFNLSLSLFVLTSFEASFTHHNSWIFWLANGLIPASLFHLVVRYPEEQAVCRHYRAIIPGVYIFFMGLSALPFTPLRETNPYLIRNTMGFFALTTGIIGLFFFISMFRLYRSTAETTQSNLTALKLRVKILTLAAFFAFVVPGILSVSDVWSDKLYIPFNYLSLCFLIFPFTTAIALVQYNLFNVETYLKKAITAGFYSGLIIVTYCLCVFICHLVEIDSLLQTPYFALFFTFITFALFSPFSVLFQKGLNRLLSKNQKTYQQSINELSQQLTSVLMREDIIETLAKTLITDIHITHMSIWLQNAPNHSRCYELGKGSVCIYTELNREIKDILALWEKRTQPLFITEVQESPHFSSTERQLLLAALAHLNAVLIFPLFVRDELTGMLFLGERYNRQSFNADDIALLMPLTYQVAIALANASAYEEIQELNENLEQKVIERTQVLLQTIEEKELTQQQLIRSESLAAIGQLVAGVAHELNNPLGSAHSLVQSTVEILEEKETLSADEEEMIDDLRFVIKEQKRAKDIVSSLLDLSRQTQSYEEPVYLNQVIDDAIRILHNKYKYNNIHIERQYDDNLPVINGNFSQLGQVFLNIIQNSIQASPSQEGHIILRTSNNDHEVCFHCLDNGSGIPEEALKDIFKPFFTTKKVGEGTGLGLYICHEIISKHQGKINVYNSDSGGAISEVKLPLQRTLVQVA